MKNTIFIGIFVLVIGVIVTYFQLDEIEDMDGISLYLPGILVGIGLGLIFGSLIGYQSKSRAIKKEAKRKELEG